MTPAHSHRASPKKTGGRLTGLFALLVGASLPMMIVGSSYRDRQVRAACEQTVSKFPDTTGTAAGAFCAQAMQSNLCPVSKPPSMIARGGMQIGPVDCTSRTSQMLGMAHQMAASALEVPSIWLSEQGAEEAFFRQLSTVEKRTVTRPDLEERLRLEAAATPPPQPTRPANKESLQNLSERLGHPAAGGAKP